MLICQNLVVNYFHKHSTFSRPLYTSIWVNIGLMAEGPIEILHFNAVQWNQVTRK
jgi:hypothetical protein